MPLRTAPKLHLNEHLSPRLAHELRQYGFDVTSSQEAALLTTSDEEQLAFAASAHRAIVTLNVSDFMVLHARYVAEDKIHWGIICSTRESISVLFHRLLRFLNAVPAEELKNQFRWLNEFK